MAKQTFTTGQVLTAAQMTSLQQTAMLGGAANAKTASYVLVAADAGDAITMSNAGATTITVNTGLFAAGDIVTIINLGAGACTITAGTATVATSGSLVLAQNQGGVLRFTSASAAIFFQFATPASGDIEGVTAGTGISGGGTSGTVTITNSMATAIDAKGDLVVGTGADTFSRLAVGANGTTLVADSAEATGLKWAAPASGGGFTLLSTTTFSGTTTTVSSINQSHKHLLIQVNGLTTSGNLDIRLNGSTTGAYLTAVGYTSTAVRLNGQCGPGFTHNASTSNSDMSVILWVYSYSDTARDKPISASAFFNSTAPDPIPVIYGGYFNDTAAITSIDFVTGSSVSTGTVRLWGVS